MYKKNSKGDLDLHPTPNPSLNPAHDNVDTQKQSSAGYRQGGGGFTCNGSTPICT